MTLPPRSFVPAVVLAASLTLIGIAAITVAGRGNPLIGPCAGRLAENGTYWRLALRLTSDRIGSDTDLDRDPTPARVEAQIARIARVRAEYVPSITDTCLAAHVSDWLGFYERQTRTVIARKAERGGFNSDFEKRWAEEEDQTRALASRLGIKR